MSGVLLVTDIFPPDIGGPATFIPALGTALVEAGHRVTVVCRADDPRAPLREAWPFRLLRTPRRGGASRRPRLLWTLWREARRHDVVFSNGLERATAWACRAGGRSYTVKVVGDLAWERARGEGLTNLSLDEFQAAPAAGRPWRRWAAGQHAAARRARRVITPSDYLRRLVLGWGVEPARAVTVHNGIHLGEFAGLAPRPRPPGMPLQVLWVGRIVNHKGLELLLEALAGVDGIELDLVGDGPAAPRSARWRAGSAWTAACDSTGSGPAPMSCGISRGRTCWCCPASTRACRTRCSRPRRPGSRASPPTGAATPRSSSTAGAACS